MPRRAVSVADRVPELSAARSGFVAGAVNGFIVIVLTIIATAFMAGGFLSIIGA
jgi:hypothetical protein